jgi:hypothetical protein
MTDNKDKSRKSDHQIFLSLKSTKTKIKMLMKQINKILKVLEKYKI